jgi:hypothetical protein
MTIFRAINALDDCTLLQSDIEHIQGCFAAKFMHLSSSKTRVIAFAREPNVLYNTHTFWDSALTRMDSVKDVEVKLDSKLHFLTHVGYIFSQSVKMLGLLRTMAYSFLPLIIY